jgi:hypothetical protein
MRELLVRGKNTIDPEVIDPGGRSVEDSLVESDFTFTLPYSSKNKLFLISFTGRVIHSFIPSINPPIIIGGLID